MATQVIMPQMGDTIAEGTITKWLVEVGSAVERDQPLFEISTDKVDAEIPSPGTGVLRQILCPAGRTVPVNSIVAWITPDMAEPVPAVESLPSIRPQPSAPSQGPSSFAIIAVVFAIQLFGQILDFALEEKEIYVPLLTAAATLLFTALAFGKSKREKLSKLLLAASAILALAGFASLVADPGLPL